MKRLRKAGRKGTKFGFLYSGRRIMARESERVAGFGKLEAGLTGSGNFTRWVRPKDRTLPSAGSAAS
jgi:hypothetical protein